MTIEDNVSVPQGQFSFGRNWRRFLSMLDEDRIVEAVRSLQRMMAGRTFLDVGSGSGLFSLAAMRLDAQRVHSFDYDLESAACTKELKQRYSPMAENWTIESGSVLDTTYLRRLGQWDVVYSWGVLHHTGEMRLALGNMTELVAEGGTLFISVYNDQGLLSRIWRKVKTLYNAGTIARWTVIAVFVPYLVFRGIITDVLRGRNPLRRYLEYKWHSRGMSMIIDWIDWLGGSPFEVAKPEEITDFYARKGFRLRKLKTCGKKLGCNEFVFERHPKIPRERSREEVETEGGPH